MPLQIYANATGTPVAILAAPVDFAVGTPLDPSTCSLELNTSTSTVTWVATCSTPSAVVRGSMDFTGFINLAVSSTVAPVAGGALSVRWQASAAAAVFGMGLGAHAALLGDIVGSKGPADWLVLDFGTPQTFDGQLQALRTIMAI